MDEKQIKYINEREQKAAEALSALGIKYTRYEHESADTMEKCEHIGEELGAKHCKNLFLTNRQCTDFYLMLISADKPFRTKDISKQLSVSRLSFANNDFLLEKLNLLPGSVTPLGLVSDNARDVTVVIDEALLLNDMICVHPCVSTVSYAMPTKELLRFIDSCGNAVRYVTITVESDVESNVEPAENQQ